MHACSGEPVYKISYPSLHKQLRRIGHFTKRFFKFSCESVFTCKISSVANPCPIVDFSRIFNHQNRKSETVTLTIDIVRVNSGLNSAISFVYDAPEKRFIHSMLHYQTAHQSIALYD